MNRVTVQIDELGALHIYVGEQPVSMIEDVVLTGSNRHNPHLQITFLDVDKIDGMSDADKRSMLSSIHSFKILLAKNPFVRFFDKGDTQPSGVRVTPREEG